MKRQNERDSSPINKKSREISDELKRSGRISPGEERRRTEESREYYRSLCVRNLHSKLTNEEIEAILGHEYNQFGEFNIKVAQFNGERVAYINFKFPENARSARYTKPTPVICDKQCVVDPVLGSKFKHGPGNYDDVDRHRRLSSPRVRTEPEKKDKFPHHLYHIEPEDDPKATRTLFVGNLAPDIEDSDLRYLFSKLGIIEDIDIKHPTKGTNNNSYAFVKYANLDMAHKAKVVMSGKVIKNFQCKIGYGKVTPTKCLWVGGLGPWIQYDVLEKAFSHFGIIQEIDWPLNKNYAYLLFENVESAVAACESLRGFKLGDGEKRIRVDFTDETHVHNDPGNVKNNSFTSENGTKVCRVGEISLICGDTYRFTNLQSGDHSNYKRSSDSTKMTFETSTMVLEMIKCMRQVWTGRFFLKNNYFGSKVFYLRGEQRMVDHFLQPLTPVSSVQLRMERKLKLDYHILDDVYSKILSGGDEGICIMLAVSENLDSIQNETMSTEIVPYSEKEKLNDKHTPSKDLVKRHLKALSAYLRIKQAAGKVILQAGSDDANGFGTLHVFPPCEFSQKILMETSPLLTSDYSRDDFLLLILVRCY